METEMGVEQPRRRRLLNPFSFPAETDIMFVLLVVAGATVAFVLGTTFQHALGLGPEWSGDETIAAEGNDNLTSVDEQTVGHAWSAWSDLSMLVIAGGLIFGLATFLYRKHPDRVRRRHGLVPFPSGKDDVFLAEVHAMAAEAGLETPPVVEMKPGFKSQGAQAFGIKPRFVLRLDGGLRLARKKAPRVFRAIVLHELAHLRNKDVGRTYFTEALWTSARWLVIVPLIVVLSVILVRGQLDDFDLERLLGKNLPALGLICLQAGGLLLLVGVVRTLLLRSREYYADCRAGMFGVRDTLRSLLTRKSGRKRASSRWTAPWRLHPTAEARAAVLADPRPLFACSVTLAAVVGVLLGLAIEGVMRTAVPFALGVSSMLGLGVEETMEAGDLDAASLQLTGSMVAAQAILIGSFVFVGWLLAGTVGQQVQRGAVARAACGEGPVGLPKLLGVALVVALGMELGFLLVPGVFGIRSLEKLALGLAVTGGFFAWAFLCVFAIRLSARWMLPGKAGNRAPVIRRRWITATASLWAGCSIVPLLIMRYITFYSDATTDTATMTGFAAAMFGVSVVVAVLGLGINWLLGRMLLSRCPKCSARPAEGIAVGRLCTKCGAELSAWAFQPAEPVEAGKPSVSGKPVQPPPLPGGPPPLPSAT